jgi:hypothetical protein
VETAPERGIVEVEREETGNAIIEELELKEQEGKQLGDQR